MKTAICMSGYPDALKFTHENLLDYFNKYIEDYDIYVYSPECDSAKNIEKYFTKNTTILIEKDQPIPEPRISNHRFKTGIQAYLQQINGWKQSNELRKSSGIKYDRVIRCRVDIAFNGAWPKLSELPNDRIYIPNFHHHWGLNDRFCISSAEFIDNYMNIIDNISKNIQIFNHAETYLAASLAISNTPISLIDIDFCRYNGQGVNREKPGYLIKKEYRYPKELIKKI
tara:strand:- start:283 stop:963 length:681 start_codon:yes stop_codon:yes gene_type:complete